MAPRQAGDNFRAYKPPTDNSQDSHKNGPSSGFHSFSLAGSVNRKPKRSSSELPWMQPQHNFRMRSTSFDSSNKAEVQVDHSIQTPVYRRPTLDEDVDMDPGNLVEHANDHPFQGFYIPNVPSTPANAAPSMGYDHILKSPFPHRIHASPSPELNSRAFSMDYTPEFNNMTPGLDGASTSLVTPSPSLSRRSSHMSVDSNCSGGYDPSTSVVERTRKPKNTKQSVMLNVLKELTDSKINLADLVAYVVEGNSDFQSYRRAFFGSKNRCSLISMLDRIADDAKGAIMFRGWVMPRALDFVCEKIHTEMEEAKPHLRMSTSDVGPEFISNWDINAIMNPVSQTITPTWTAILDAASESKSAKLKAQSGKSRNRDTSRNILSACVHFLRSLASSKVQIGLGLMAWSTGASKQLINLLHHSCLSMSYSSVSSIISSLAEGSIKRARITASGPHSLAYDNINMKSSIFVEQGPNMMAKVQSGTFPVIYELRNARLEDMRIKQIMDNFRKSTPLQLRDCCPTPIGMESYARQAVITLSQVLFKYVQGFNEYKTKVEFQYVARRPMPEGYETVFHALRATTIEEASIIGNIHVHKDVYIVQLQKLEEDLDEYAIPSFNDQLTNSRIRSAQILRQNDVSAWERREVFQLGPGLFHLVMNLIWSILETHRGTVSQPGSLTHLFAVLEKTRLGGEHPDFHTLLMALSQVFDGLAINAWRIECGHGTLEEYAASNPSAQAILDLASAIIYKYATPQTRHEPINPKVPLEDLNLDEHACLSTESASTSLPSNSNASRKNHTPAKSTSQESEPEPPNIGRDIAYENIVLLMRDLLYIMELVNALKIGDFGRVEDILPTLACMFRGAGSNNYSTEILHLLFNIKEVWTPEFANIMRDNMIVNPSGLPGHAMGIDLNIEHLIGYLKALFAAKGIYSNWDRLGNISAGISYLQMIKKQVMKTVRAGYQGSIHTAPDLSALVWRIANKVQDLDLQKNVTNREGNSDMKPVVNVVDEGYKKFESSSLATFNKKINEAKEGRPTDITEIDELAPCGITPESEDKDSVDLSEDISVLHDL